MTIQDLMRKEAFEPTKTKAGHGTWQYECQICAARVGVYRPADGGMQWIRYKCKNGHNVDWSNVKALHVINGRLFDKRINEQLYVGG